MIRKVIRDYGTTQEKKLLFKVLFPSAIGLLNLTIVSWNETSYLLCYGLLLTCSWVLFVCFVYVFWGVCRLLKLNCPLRYKSVL